MMGKRLQATINLKNLIDEYYKKMFRYFNEKRPVAWLNVGIPCELFWAMDVFPFYPENYGALCGARKVATELSQIAESFGFSQDLCSYARVNLATVLSGKGPLGEIPPPTIQVCATNSCITVLTWWRAVGYFKNVPTIVIDTPIVQYESDALHLDYTEKQFRKMIESIENITGRKFDIERLIEVTEISNETKLLWSEVLNARKNIPSPINAGDVFTHMFPMVALRGTEEGLRHLTSLKNEVYERLSNPEPDHNEKYRLLWDNLPVWYDLKLFDYLEQYGAIFVTDTYTQAWGPEFMGIVDLDNPLRSYAYFCASGFLNVGFDRRYKLIKQLVDEYSVDGIVMHSDRSCKPYSLIQHEIKRKIMDERGIPSLIIEADHSDSGNYSSESIKTRIESFLETIDGLK